MAHVDDLITDARFYASQVLFGAGQAMGQAMNAITSLGAVGLPDDLLEGLNSLVPPLPPNPVAIPGYAGSRFDPADPPDGPPELIDPGDLQEPPEPGKPPDVRRYVAPPQPAQTVPNPSQIGPQPNLNIDQIVASIPMPPELQSKIDAIPVPPMSDINLPPTPELILPVYQPGPPPRDPGPPPDNLDDLLRQQFETISPVMQNALRAQFDAWIDFYYPTLRAGVAAMEAKLDEFLLGGTGLTPIQEDALYNRALDKNGAEYTRARAGAYAEGAKLGFTLPPPLVYQQAKEIDQSYRDNLARTANEIMVKNAELEQQNIQFALTLRSNASTAHMSAAISYYGHLVQVNGQALQYAIAVVEQVAKVYGLAIEYAKVQIQLEESRIHLYEAQLKAATMVIEFYKAQIEGELAKVTVDKARVELYTAQLHAVEVQASIYNTEMQGARLRGDIEKLKVELYDANVRAYAATVSAYSAGWSGYEAAVRGAVADVNGSVEQIRGYSAQAEYFRTILTGRISEIEAKQRQNEGNTRVYEAQINAYRALNQAEIESVKAEHEDYDLQLKTRLSEQTVRGEYYRSQISYFDMAAKAMLETVRMALEDIREVNRMNLGKAQAIATLSAAIGHDYAATAQSALSGLNTLAGEVKTTTS